MNLRHEIVSSLDLKDPPVFRLFPYSCKYCVYWESTGDFDEKISSEKAHQIKSAWFKKVSDEFGDCGLIAYSDNESVGYAQFALSKFFPKAQQYQSGPPSDDSVFLACLYVPRRELRGMGIGKYLLDSVLSNLEKGGYAAIETYARKGSESNPTGPLSFYLKNGFFVKRTCDEFPLVRKEFGMHTE